MSSIYIVEVVDVRGKYAAGYKSGDSFRIKGFYIDPGEYEAKIYISYIVSKSFTISLHEQ